MTEKEKIEYTKYLISYYVKEKIITKEDLLKITTLNKDFFNNNDLKNKMLSNLYNCPFLLNLDDLEESLLKNKWLVFIYSRFEDEINELRYQLNKGIISKNEYMEIYNDLREKYFINDEDKKRVKKL
ncbi:MAG: hypothetical protein Q4E75_05135 [bacterium]|nr:hypothetical protein [bacterium]